MIRRSIILPTSLNQRLDMIAKDEAKNFSEVVRDLIGKALKTEEQARRDRMYQAIDRLDGLGDDKITDASATINETLYGEHGAWRGEHE